MTEPTTAEIQEWYDGNWGYVGIPDKSTLIGILLKRLEELTTWHNSECLEHACTTTRLTAAKNHINKVNKSNAQFELDLIKAEQTIKNVEIALNNHIKKGHSPTKFILTIQSMFKEKSHE